MYESLHVAVKMYRPINYSFCYFYICCFITAELCSLCTVVLVILPIWKIIWKRHCFYFQSENCIRSNSDWLQFPGNNNTFRVTQHIVKLLQVIEILNLKSVRIVTLTFRVTWRQVTWSSRDHSFRGMWFLIGGDPLTLPAKLVRLPRYLFVEVQCQARPAFSLIY